MKIPLFDIDGTLFKMGNKLHSAAFSYAFEKVYGVMASQYEINTAGMIDNNIIIEILKLHGLAEEEVKDKIKLASEAMAQYFNEHKNQTTPEVLPGVEELLKGLKQKNIPVGVLTGNVEQIAWIKLERAGIREFFDFGAFGNQVYKRVDLVEIARENAEKNLGRSFKIEDFVIVGDTPKDINCAREAGIEVIAVATGNYSFAKLVDEKPDMTIHTLEEKDKVITFLSIGKITPF